MERYGSNSRADSTDLWGERMKIIHKIIGAIILLSIGTYIMNKSFVSLCGVSFKRYGKDSIWGEE